MGISDEFHKSPTTHSHSIHTLKANPTRTKRKNDGGKVEVHGWNSQNRPDFHILFVLEMQALFPLSSTSNQTLKIVEAQRWKSGKRDIQWQTSPRNEKECEYFYLSLVLYAKYHSFSPICNIINRNSGISTDDLSETSMAFQPMYSL